MDIDPEELIAAHLAGFNVSAYTKLVEALAYKFSGGGGGGGGGGSGSVTGGSGGAGGAGGNGSDGAVILVLDPS